MKMINYSSRDLASTPLSNSLQSRIRRYIAPWTGAILLLFSGAVLADPSVELEILNPTDSNGDIVIVAGEDVEVGFSTLADTENVLKRWDRIQLVNVADGVVLSSKRRGRRDQGSISLKVPPKKIPAGSLIQIYVRYVIFNTGEIITSVADPQEPGYTPLVAIAEATIEELTLRVTNLEDGDIDLTNEAQTLSTDGTSITLSDVAGVGGGSIALPQGPEGPQGETGPQGSQGFSGPAGPQGVTGQQGPQGDQGIQGPTGVAGADGATGPQGSQGDQGIQGLTGADGAIGPQGIAGNDGNDGATGPQGLAGTDGATGLQGPEGPQGIAGADGTDGVTGPQGLAGADGIDGATGPQGLAGADGTDGANGLQGPQGDQGIQGLTGATGPQGPQGDQGIQGLTGADGAAGLAGTDGIDGAMGPQGDQGIQGLSGPVGADGVAGPQGVAGADGAIGLQGPQGLAGNDGADGAIGPQGPQGLAGVDGALGSQGPQGDQGIQGPIGLTGPAGADGVTGADGATGPQGLAGANGKSCTAIQGTGVATISCEDGTVASIFEDTNAFNFKGNHSIASVTASPVNGNQTALNDTAQEIIADLDGATELYISGNARVSGVNLTVLNTAMNARGGYSIVLEKSNSVDFANAEILTRTSGLVFFTVDGAVFEFEGSGAVSFVDKNLDPGKAYYYRLSFLPQSLNISGGNNYLVKATDLNIIKFKK